MGLQKKLFVNYFKHLSDTRKFEEFAKDIKNKSKQDKIAELLEETLLIQTDFHRFHDSCNFRRATPRTPQARNTTEYVTFLSPPTRNLDLLLRALSLSFMTQ